MKKILVTPLGWAAQLSDALLVPIMYLVSGTFSEAPQRTHRWNNIRLKKEDVETLDRALMVHCSGVPSAMRRINPIYHLQIFGGWRDYVVLSPTDTARPWRVGWITYDRIGVSRILLHSPARTLIGPADVSFFAIDGETGEQLPLMKLATGRVGEGGTYMKTPLL